jgi:DNA-binding transcriptional ArsR family regulator
VTVFPAVFPTESRGFAPPEGASGAGPVVDAVLSADAPGFEPAAGASGTGPPVDASGTESVAGLHDPGRVFAALADPRRRELLELLAGTPGASAGVLAARLPVSRQAVAQHLAVLEECALVTRRRAGRQVLFSVRPEGMKATADWLLARTAAWLGQ